MWWRRPSSDGPIAGPLPDVDTAALPTDTGELMKLADDQAHALQVSAALLVRVVAELRARNEAGHRGGRPGDEGQEHDDPYR